MGLQGDLAPDHRAVTDLDEVELGEVCGRDPRPPADPGAEQAQRGRQERSAGEQEKQARHRGGLVQPGDELAAAHEPRPQRLHPRPVGADEQPLHRGHGAEQQQRREHPQERRDQQRRGRRCAARRDREREQVQVDRAREQRSGQRRAEELEPEPLGHLAPRRPEGLGLGEVAAALARGQVDGGRAEPGAALRHAPGWGHGLNAEQGLAAHPRAGRDDRRVADEGARPDLGVAERHPTPVERGATDARHVRHEALPADGEQRRVEVRRRRDLRTAPDPGAERAQQRDRVERRVRRVRVRQAHLQQLVGHPLAHSEPGPRHVDARPGNRPDHHVDRHDRHARRHHEQRPCPQRREQAGALAEQEQRAPDQQYRRQQHQQRHHLEQDEPDRGAQAVPHPPARDITRGRPGGGVDLRVDLCVDLGDSRVDLIRRRRRGARPPLTGRDGDPLHRGGLHGQLGAVPDPGAGLEHRARTHEDARPHLDRRDGHPTVLDRPRPQRHPVADVRAGADAQHARRGDHGGADVGVPADPGAEQPQERPDERRTAQHRERRQGQHEVGGPQQQVRRAPQPVPAGADQPSRPTHQDRRQQPAQHQVDRGRGQSDGREDLKGDPPVVRVVDRRDGQAQQQHERVQEPGLQAAREEVARAGRSHRVGARPLGRCRRLAVEVGGETTDRRVRVEVTDAHAAPDPAFPHQRDHRRREHGVPSEIGEEVGRDRQGIALEIEGSGPRVPHALFQLPVRTDDLARRDDQPTRGRGRQRLAVDLAAGHRR
jgi:hypothetical protein